MKSPQERLARASRAQMLIEDDLLRECFKILEQEYFKAWVNTTEAETQARENYWRAINQLGDLRNHLNSVINDGKIAQAEINKLGGLNRYAA